jgi:hypothetical protein
MPPFETSFFSKSVVNSSTSALGASATFTGTGELNGFPDVLLTCKADADGTLFAEFSDTGEFNGEQSIFPVAGFSVSANIYEFHTAVKGPRYFRTRFVNGSSDQSSFRLDVYYGTFRQGNLPVNQSIGFDADATVVRSVDSSLDLAFGNFSGLSENAKFGRVTGLDAADTSVDIWALGDDTESPRLDRLVFPSTQQPIFLSSSSASDTAGS